MIYITYKKKRPNRSGKAKRNISQSIPNGTIVHTRDEYFKGQSFFRKPGYESRGNYRKSVVVDSNRNDELALVKLGTSSGKELPNYAAGKSKYRPIVLTLDDKGNRIKIGHKFARKGVSSEMSIRDVNNIKKDLMTGKHSQSNRRRLRELKGRK